MGSDRASVQVHYTAFSRKRQEEPTEGKALHTPKEYAHGGRGPHSARDSALLRWVAAYAGDHTS
jgi:hypothetical protein